MNLHYTFRIWPYDARNLLFIIKGMIMPGDVMKDQSILFSANFNSTSCYLPVFGAAFSIMYIFKNKGWLRNLLLALFVISFPILQATFILYKGNLSIRDGGSCLYSLCRCRHPW